MLKSDFEIIRKELTRACNGIIIFEMEEKKWQDIMDIV